MRIVLSRHGRPDAVSTAPIAGQEIGRWVRDYGNAGITKTVAPSAIARDMVASSGCVLTSDVRRARESADWLAGSKNVRIDPELREAALPDSIGFSMRFSPRLWVVLARVSWWLSWCEAGETVAMTRQRAQQVADRLEAFATEYGSVVVIGHGMFNRFVARQLRKRGWLGPMLLRRGYWSVAQFDRR